MKNNHIKELRLKKKISQDALAKIVGVTQQTIYKYESGRCLPSGQTMADLCNYFDCSADYLLGRTDARQVNKNIESYKENFEQMILYYNMLDTDDQQRIIDFAKMLAVSKAAED